MKPGDTLVLQGENFKVAGVFHSFSVYENGAIIVPLKKLQSMSGRPGSVTGFSIVLDAAGKQRVDEICKQVDKLGSMANGQQELAASPTKEHVANSLHIKGAHAMAWLTSVVAVVVGAIGVLNTMIMSVVERTKEISVLRAIGWRKSNIIRMILGESIVLCAAGALVGCSVAAAFIYWLTSLPQANGFVQGSLSPLIVAKGLMIATAVGVLGGSVSGLSRLDPGADRRLAARVGEPRSRSPPLRY